MSAVSLVASLLLGAAFVLAGGSKLAAGLAWEAQARELGRPAIRGADPCRGSSSPSARR